MSSPQKLIEGLTYKITTMTYLSKNIDGLVYSEDFGGWIDEQEMHNANEEYDQEQREYYGIEDQVDVYLNL